MTTPHTEGSRPRHMVQAALFPALILALVLGSVVPATAPQSISAQDENLLDRISNERMVVFEQGLEKDINGALRRYLSPGQFVLSVRVIWDRNVIPSIDAPGLQPDKHKLPGFPIFVRSPRSPVDDTTPSFTRLVVKILMDETLPEYYERFLRKIVPIVARFVPTRGDQLIVLKETFPDLNRDQLPPTIPERELMGQIGEPLNSPADLAETRTSLIEEARLAYDEGRYTEALRLVQLGFQKATSNKQRATFLGMEGSVHYTMKNLDAARASWRRALAHNPGANDVHRVLNYLDSQQGRPGTTTQ